MNSITVPLVLLICVNQVWSKPAPPRQQQQQKVQKDKGYAGIAIDSDIESLMRGMTEIERGNGRIVYAKWEKTPTGSLETKVIVPDQELTQLPPGMQQIGGPTYSDSGWEQQNQQWLPQEMGPEEEVVLPDRQFDQYQG